MCNPDPGDDPWQYGASIANLWRTATDIQDNFGSMLANFEGTVDHFADAGPGAWNDPDLLQIGNGGSSPLEYTTEFSLWAEMAAPLIASTNLATLTHSELAIYENPNVIAVDQDPLGRPGVPISSAHGLWVLAKPLSGGGRAVLLFNATNTAAPVSTTAAAAGLPRVQVYQMHNLWTDAVTQTAGAISAFVPGHGVAMFTVTTAGKRRGHKLPPHTVLSLDAASPQVGVGGSTTVSESFTNVGVSDVKKLRLSLSASPGWQVKPLGRAGAPLLDPGQRFTVAYRVTAPRSGPPLAFSIFTGGASYDPPDGRAHVLGQARRAGLLAGARAAVDGRRDHAPGLVRRIRPGSRDQRAGVGGVQPAVRGAADRFVRGDLRARRGPPLLDRAGHGHLRPGRGHLGRRRSDRARRYDPRQALARRRGAVRE